jgi:hypothetical protein
MKIYLVFYILLLKLVPENAKLLIDIEVKDKNTREAESIEGRKLIRGRAHYLIK